MQTREFESWAGELESQGGNFDSQAPELKSSARKVNFEQKEFELPPCGAFPAALQMWQQH